MTDRLRERFVVTNVGGRAFSGLLHSIDDRTLVLVDCRVVKDDGGEIPVDGEVILRRDGVLYMQRP